MFKAGLAKFGYVHQGHSTLERERALCTELKGILRYNFIFSPFFSYLLLCIMSCVFFFFFFYVCHIFMLVFIVLC